MLEEPPECCICEGRHHTALCDDYPKLLDVLETNRENLLDEQRKEEL